ncbi:MAG: GAF domain-containing sensor histidine kinase [Chloroflexota bacterium]|nr:GAF domain-containing sensor histidine kinase [Chloroflexota bacterium]
MQTETPLPEPVSPSAQVLASIITAQAEMTTAMPDSDAIMRLVTRHAMALTGATGASISVRDGDDVYLPVNEGFTAEWEGARFPIASTMSGQCLLTGEQYFVPDVDYASPEASEIARSSHVRTFLAVPLRHEDRVVAALCVVAPQPYAFGENEILVVQLLARIAGSKLAHAQAFNELRLAWEDAKQARAEVADFASMIAHELGSPVAAIQNAAELLGMTALNPQQGRARDLIELESRALRMLVGDLRAASSLEREAFDLHLRVVSLDTLVVEAGDFAQAFDSTHPVHVQVGSQLTVSVDPGRIAQVLRNLVTNAVKYTPPGAPIEIQSWRDEDRAWVAVVDQGPGIAPEDVGLIFSKFGRARNRVDHKIPGLGLGLYLSKRIVEAHGGELVVTSAPGEGASFAFSLPLAP